jgi:hypothetical protein
VETICPRCALATRLGRLPGYHYWTAATLGSDRPGSSTRLKLVLSTITAATTMTSTTTAVRTSSTMAMMRAALAA